MTARPLLNVVCEPEAPASHAARVGVLGEDREVLGPHAELLGDEQRQRHHGARAALLRAGDDRARAVAVQLHERARRAAERRPPADADADRLVLGQVLAVADQLDRALERLGSADRLEHLVGGGRVALLQDVPAAQLDRVHADRRGDRVHVLLDGPACLRGRGRAHRARRRRVRVGQAGVDRHVGDPVRPDRVHRRELREERGVGAVGAVVEDQPAAPGDERAVVHDARLELDHLALAAVVGGDELLAAREDEPHRAARWRGPARRRGPRSGTRTCRRTRRRGAGR